MRVLVFSGTSEGKEIAEYLDSKGVDTVVSVATEYGRMVMEDMPFVSVHTGRLDTRGMSRLAAGCDFVIDATHPYAENVTVNIRAACKRLDIEYIRLVRDDIKYPNAVVVQDIKEAVELLKHTQGGIFVSTGSKELQLYCDIPDYVNRITARVLPVPQAEDKCRMLGIENVIFGKGPFSYNDNIKAFKQYNVKWLVTKSSGKSGGFDEKIQAAESLGINVIVIKRPEDKGFSVQEVKNLIDQRLHKRKFPLFIDITGKKAVVVGGGEIAVRRINTLIEFGARITVVADKIQKKDIKGRVEYVERLFKPEDINDAFMVVAATDDRAVNHCIYEICTEKNIPVSVADCKRECTFYFPAVCFNNSLSIGVVSDGSNHSLVKNTAVEIRRLIGHG